MRHLPEPHSPHLFPKVGYDLTAGSDLSLPFGLPAIASLPEGWEAAERQPEVLRPEQPPFKPSCVPVCRRRLRALRSKAQRLAGWISKCVFPVFSHRRIGARMSLVEQT